MLTKNWGGGAGDGPPMFERALCGVYIPPVFRKYYYKLTVFSNAYRRHVTMGMDLSVVCL